MATYSFQQIIGVLGGPGGVVNLGNGSASAEEGISWNMVDDKNKLDIGADGASQHSLHAGKAATLSVKLLKTSPTNALLEAMYNIQTNVAKLHGTNTVTITDITSGNVHVGRDVAFKKHPDLVYGKDGQMMDWTFDVGQSDHILGVY